MSETTVAPLAVTKVNIGSPGIDYREVQFAIEDGVASISASSGHLLGTKPGVAQVDHPTAQRWIVTFEDGSAWTVMRASGCGCGGR